VLKNFFNDFGLVNEADDAHLSLAFGTGKGIQRFFGKGRVMARNHATIVVVPRERFSYSRRSLESIFQHTTPPFQLVYVDGGSPRDMQRYLRAAAQERNFKLIRSERYLSPNEARNIGSSGVTTKYVIFVDNDVLVTPGWLDKLIGCAEESAAWIVGPVYCIGEPAGKVIHMAGGGCRILHTDAGRHFHEEHLHQNKLLSDVVGSLRRGPTEMVEFHCMLMRTDVLERLGPLDEKLLCSREHIDISMLVRQAGGEIYFEPESVVTYVPASRFAVSDVPYYLLRWSDEWGFATMRHFHSKWRLDDPDYRIVDQWLRKHRRDLFARLRATTIRFLGWRIGNRVTNSLVRLAESAVTPIARRKGHAA
jgi:GT2 family glycosyltransferase